MPDGVTRRHEENLKSNLDKLSEALAEGSRGIPLATRNEENILRPVLLGALEVWDKSSFTMGRILCDYKDAYRSTGDLTWGIAEEAIAAAVGCSTRTLRRLMERYQEASKLPDTVLDAMEASGINPVTATSSKIVSNLLYLVGSKSDPDEKEATEFVKKAMAKDPRSNYVTLTREQKLIWQDRVAIRKMLGRSNKSDRLGTLKRALAQELMAWGINEPIEVKIVPCSGPFTVDGLIKVDTDEPDTCNAEASEVA
jgi:hypothetical protein